MSRREARVRLRDTALTYSLTTLNDHVLGERVLLDTRLEDLEEAALEYAEERGWSAPVRKGRRP